MTVPVGQILGTQDAMPLEFWVAVAPGQFLELDDVVVVRTALPNGQVVTLYGTVDIVKARHEGVQFDTDVFRVTEGTLPAGLSLSAHVAVTRIEATLALRKLAEERVRSSSLPPSANSPTARWPSRSRFAPVWCGGSRWVCPGTVR